MLNKIRSIIGTFSLLNTRKITLKTTAKKIGAPTFFISFNVISIMLQLSTRLIIQAQKFFLRIVARKICVVCRGNIANQRTLLINSAEIRSFIQKSANAVSAMIVTERRHIPDIPTA